VTQSPARMTRDEWASITAIAATVWPHERAFFTEPPPGSPAPRDTWYAAVQRFAPQDVMTALERLAERSERFPSLAQLVAATRNAADERERADAIRDEEQLRLTPPVTKKAAEKLADVERGAAEWKAAAAAEIEMFCRRVALRGVEPTTHRRRLLDELDRVCSGPWSQRARAVIAGEVRPGEGLDEFFAGLSEPAWVIGHERPVAAVLATQDIAPPPTEPRRPGTGEVIDVPARVVLSAEEVERRAQEVLQLIEAGERVPPAAVEQRVRDRVRELLAARQQQPQEV
jgi:hypothetical protein